MLENSRAFMCVISTEGTNASFNSSTIDYVFAYCFNDLDGARAEFLNGNIS
jgi:hypothetical protein